MKLKQLAVSLGALFLAVTVKAQTTDDVLNLLIQNKVISQTSADSIRAEYAIKQQGVKSKQSWFPVNAGKSFQLSGYAQFRYQGYDSAAPTIKDGFDVRRARLDLQGAISSKWDYRLQVEYGGASGVTLLDAYVTYKPYDFLKIIAGQFIIPFSVENIISDRVLEAVDRSQVVNALVARKGDASNGIQDAIGNQNGRDVGIQLSGSVVKIRDRYIADYYVAYLNGNGINITDFNKAKDVSARLVFHPFKILDIGGSYYNGYDSLPNTAYSKIKTNNQVRKRWGAEVSLNYKRYSFRSEFIRGEEGNTNPYIHQGWYAQAAYYVLPEKLQAVFRYDTYDPNVDGVGVYANTANTYYIFGVNYFFNKWAKLQLNYSWRTEQIRDINNNVATAQLQVVF